MAFAEKIPIAGLQVFEGRLFRDDRGFFTEAFRRDEAARAGLPELIQDNHSRSKPGVLRGLHFQRDPHAQGKLVRAAHGRIWDVAVDLRPGSPTFGRHWGLELSGENGRALWIPPGFAHGFCVLGDEPADVIYKVDVYYHAASDAGIRWNDPELAIAWPVSAPIVSSKDAALPSFREASAVSSKQ